MNYDRHLLEFFTVINGKEFQKMFFGEKNSIVSEVNVQMKPPP